MQTPNILANTSYELYLETFQELYEHSIWVIEKSYEEVKNNSLYDNLESFHLLLSNIVLDASKDLQMSLIKAHPMLAGKKAQKNELTDFSTQEQKSAGLNTCTSEEIQLFEKLNSEYFKKFDFPYILAVKGRNKKQIIENFQSRLNNSFEEEKKEALNQINQIGLLRIKDIYEQ